MQTRRGRVRAPHRAGSTPGLGLSGGPRPSHSGPGLQQSAHGSSGRCSLPAHGNLSAQLLLWDKNSWKRSRQENVKCFQFQTRWVTAITPHLFGTRVGCDRHAAARRLGGQVSRCPHCLSSVDPGLLEARDIPQGSGAGFKAGWPAWSIQTNRHNSCMFDGRWLPLREQFPATIKAHGVCHVVPRGRRALGGETHAPLFCTRGAAAG